MKPKELPLAREPLITGEVGLANAPGGPGGGEVKLIPARPAEPRKGCLALQNRLPQRNMRPNGLDSVTKF